MSAQNSTEGQLQRKQAVAARMAERYGTNRSNWPVITVATVAIIAFLLTAAWVGLQVVDRPYEGRVLRSTPESERVVDVDLELRGESDTPVECIIRVKDASASDVGYATVTFDGAPMTQTFRIPTIVRSSSVEILGCVDAGEELVVAPADYPPGVAPPPDRPLE